MVGKPQPQTASKLDEMEAHADEQKADKLTKHNESHSHAGVDGEGDEVATQRQNRVRPDTNDGEVFADGEGFTDDYIAEVEAELDAYEASIKAVRAEIRSVKSAKGERDFGALRHSMHELSHGNPLTRTAHAVVTRRDGPEQLRPAPSHHDNVSSGPGEELNAEQHAHRVVGR
jgi:hypothetical protein